MKNIKKAGMWMVLMVVTILFSGIVFAQTWQIQTVDSTGDVGAFNSIAIDSTDNPHISYQDGTNLDLKYAKWTGSVWQKEMVDSSPMGIADTSIALDSNNYPHISYSYSDGKLKLKYAKWTGLAWQKQIVDDTSWLISYDSIALDSSGNPHISYYYETDDFNNVVQDLKYAKYVGSGGNCGSNKWSCSTVDSTGNVGLYTSIAVDSSGNPHIAYYDATNQDLKYAKYVGSGGNCGSNKWSCSTVDSTGNVGLYTSIAIDSSGNPHISYHQAAGSLKYATWTGTAWQIQAVDPNPGSIASGHYTKIVLGSNNYPNIVYSKGGNLTYVRWTGTSWNIEKVVTGCSCVNGFSMALHFNNNPYISYFNQTSKVLRYAKRICAPEVCTDGIDNDCDGQIDCADADCAAAPGCAFVYQCPVKAAVNSCSYTNCANDCCEDTGPYGIIDMNNPPSTCTGQIGPGSDCNVIDIKSCFSLTGGLGTCAYEDCSNKCWPVESVYICANVCEDADGDDFRTRHYSTGQNVTVGELGCNLSITNILNPLYCHYKTSLIVSDIGCGPADCNETDPSVYPGAPELCDGKDNQCSGDAGYGTVDEGCAPVCTPTPEICNDGLDNDCDGLIDCQDTADCAYTWTNTGSIFAGNTIWSLLKASDGTIYAGTNEGPIFKSADNGATWSATNGLAGAKNIWDMMQAADGTIFAGVNNETSKKDVLKYNPSTNTWAPVGVVPFGTNSGAVRSLLQTADGAIYAGTNTNGYIFKSTDNGATWSETAELRNVVSGTISIRSLIQTSNGNIYAGTGIDNGDVFKTTNQGASWSNTGNLAGVSAAHSLLEAGSDIYAGTFENGDVFKTSNQGTTWSNTGNLAGADRAFSLLRAADGMIYAGTDAGVFKYNSTTNSWTNQGVPGGGNTYSLLQLADGTLLAGGNKGVFKLSCSAVITCTPQTENCADNADNDCDGLIDCCDSDCSANAACQEVCDNLDNNCNGDVDETFDLQTDADNCGTCNNVCAGGICEAGQCKCVLNSAQWIYPAGSDTVSDGRLVTMQVAGSDCDGETITFHVWEDDTSLAGIELLPFMDNILDDEVMENDPSPVTFAGGIATKKWPALYNTTKPDGTKTEIGQPEYYFRAATSDGTEIKSSNLLRVKGNLPPVVPAPFLIEPRGGEFYDKNATVRWNPATDPDNDPLFYILQYSGDGGKSFYPLKGAYESGKTYGYVNKVDVNGANESEFTMNFG